jgi:glycosyltransferase involved in cell wall biosynthesis
MRIVFIAHHGTVHTRRWVSFFAARGHDVHVVTCGGGDVPDVDERGRAVARRYAVHDLGSPRVGKLGYLLKLRRARSVVRGLAPDLVHAHYATSYGLLGLAAGVHPFVVTAHGDDVLISPRNPFMRAVVRRVLAAADLVTVPSEHMRGVVNGLAHARRVEVFQYGVETARLLRLREERSRSHASAPLRLVHARPLLRLYRVDLLLEALALLRRRRVDFACDVAGEGPERGKLVEQARRLGLADCVRFHGRLPTHEVERLVARADVYVSVSESDGTSLALLEALALGAVPVLSDIPANTAWIADGENGVVVAPRAESVAAGIERAAALDRARVAEQNGRLVLERADREVNLGRCERLLASLLSTAEAA